MFGGFTNHSDVLRRPVNTADSHNIASVVPQSQAVTGNGNNGLNQTDSFQGFRSNSASNGNVLEVDFVAPQPANFFRPSSSQIPGAATSRGNRTGPRYPEYALKTVRLTSFKSWSTSLKPAELLAEAGFYSTNNGDCVRCFNCGIGLRNWDPDDDPWVEHARWSSKCSYLREKKGMEFVNLVQAAVRQAEIEEALQQNSQSTNGIRTTPGDLEADTPLPGQTQNGETRGYRPSATEKKNPLLCPAAQSALEMGYLPKVVKRAVDQVLSIKGWEEMNAMNVLEILLEMEEREKQNENGERMLVKQKPNVPVPEPVQQTGKDSPELKERLRAENSELKERTTCKICCESTVSIVFLPCGHLVCCAQCSPALKDCPVCRTTVKGTVRICLA